MNQPPSIYSNLSDQTKFRLNKINKIKYYSNAKVQEKKIMSKKFSKCIAGFDFNDKILTVSSATSGGIFIISFESVIGAPVGISDASFSLIWFLLEKLLKITRNKKETTKLSCRNKLRRTETLISQAFVDL